MLIVFQAFEGRYADSPRALHEALIARGSAHEHVWLLDPAHAAGFPGGLATRRWGTPGAREALEAADLLIANTHTDVPWDKRPGARYLQTWHGTPLKRIHRDVLWAPVGRLDRLDQDVAKWDLLLSPNRDSTPWLRGAFRYDGPVLESGLPRNDVLQGPRAAQVREDVRRDLGITGEGPAVLYAPTWRDDAVFPEGGKVFELELEVERVADALGKAGGVLLLRLHYTLTGRLPAVEHPAVRDVSFHPDISDLYLAADVLVTDYSSAMFDFAVTGKPQILFTYDLEDYEQRLRGFYFELEPAAPGPLVRTSEALLEALADLDGVETAYAERQAAFRERFCHLEDGHATER
ncbi:MAG TPA: CDP-glycerol glycerophosphotransferase family protein, partial [Baekduia sp.]|nr:CDP-glycerol glycerophosphotransferase family protein [Baekduia sp.]